MFLFRKSYMIRLIQIFLAEKVTKIQNLRTVESLETLSRSGF